MSSKNNKFGFTIVELLVVIVVIGVLASLIAVAYSGISKKANEASLKSDLVSSSRLLKIHNIDNGSYPATVSTDCTTNPDSTTNRCLKLSPGNELDNRDGSPAYNRPDPQSFSLRLKNGDNIWMITHRGAPLEVTPITAVAITGDVKHGHILSAITTPQSAIATFQWQISDFDNGPFINIGGATQSEYTPTAGNIGKYLKVIVNGTEPFTGQATNNTGVVAVAFTPATYYFRSDDVLSPSVSAFSSLSAWDWGWGTSSSVDIRVEKFDTSWTQVSAQGSAVFNHVGTSNQDLTVNYAFPGVAYSATSLRIRVTMRVNVGAQSETRTFTTADLGTKFLPAGTWGIVYDCYKGSDGEEGSEDWTSASCSYGTSTTSRITNFGGF